MNKINKIKKTMACSLALMALMIMGGAETLAVESTQVANSAGEDSKSPGNPLTSEQWKLLLNTRDVLQETCDNIPNYNAMKSDVDSFIKLTNKFIKKNVKLFEKHEKKQISDQEFKSSYLSNMDVQIWIMFEGLELQNEMIEKLLSPFKIDFEKYSKEFSSVDDLSIENVKENFSELEKQFKNNKGVIKELEKLEQKLWRYANNADYSQWELLRAEVEILNSDALNAITISKTYYEDFENTLMQVRDRMDDYIKTHRVEAPHPQEL